MNKLDKAFRRKAFYEEQAEKLHDVPDMHRKIEKHIVEETEKIYELCWGFDKVVYEAGATI